VSFVQVVHQEKLAVNQLAARFLLEMENFGIDRNQ
jgi:hypothetical protein